jgi:S-adenosylmethionine decarboxylase
MHGTEWIVDAQGCSPDSLRSVDALRSLFEQIIAAMNLRTIGESVWHQFPGTGGVTGLCLLSESHLTCHTFPEFGSLCLNLFCCRPRPQWDFESQMARLFSAALVNVRVVNREYAASGEPNLVCNSNEGR